MLKATCVGKWSEQEFTGRVVSVYMLPHGDLEENARRNALGSAAAALAEAGYQPGEVLFSDGLVRIRHMPMEEAPDAAVREIQFRLPRLLALNLGADDAGNACLALTLAFGHETVTLLFFSHAEDCLELCAELGVLRDKGEAAFCAYKDYMRHLQGEERMRLHALTLDIAHLVMRRPAGDEERASGGKAEGAAEILNRMAKDAAASFSKGNGPESGWN